MIAAIVALFFVGLILLIGGGGRFCVAIRISRIKMLAAILLVLVAVVIEPYVGEGFSVNYAGIVMLVGAFILIFTRIGVRSSWKNMLCIAFIAGIIMLYRYFVPDVTESAVHGSLFVIVLMLSGYISAKSPADIIVNLTMGIGLGQAMLYLVPHYGAEMIFGGRGEVIILTVIAALLLQQIIMALSSNHKTKVHKWK